jgi:hypothetical protein
MPNIDLSILNQRQTPAFFADTLANRPAAGFLGRIFVSTDTFAFYRDNGTGWDLIGGPGTGTITGTGASGQIALWNGASTITGDTGLTYDGTANSLTADKFIVSGGTSSQFLKGDGSLDSSTYLTTNIYNGNGTLSGERTISLNGNNLIFDGGSSIARVRMDADTNVARIFSFATNNLPRFAIRIDGTESGSDAGSDFAIRRYNDAGTFVDAPFSINRATGQSTFAKKVVIENNTGDQQLQIVSSTAPSLRIDNLQTGATRRIGIGLATTTNNYIQGTTGGEFAIFNSSTTPSPILFGIYDAGLTNTQEAARISAARNFIVGSSVDAGYKFDVNGAGRFTGVLYADNTIRVGLGIIGQNSNNLLLSSLTTGGEISFWNGAFANRLMTLTGSGDLGLGIASPSGKLHIDSGNAVLNNYFTTGVSAGWDINNYFTGGNTGTEISFNLGYPGATNDVYFKRGSNGRFEIGTNNTSRLTIDGNGDATFTKSITCKDVVNIIDGGTSTKYLQLTTSNTIANIATNYTNVNIPLSLNSYGNTNQLYLSTAGNVLVNSSTDVGQKLFVKGNIYNEGKTITSYQTNASIQDQYGNDNAQGTAQKFVVLRQYSVVSLGTKLIIPIKSQVSQNNTTLCRVWGHSARYNARAALGFEINFSVGSLNLLSDLTSWGGGGNFSGVSIAGMNIEIDFTTAYTQATASGIFVTIEYMTANNSGSIDVANITMN